MQLCMPLLKVLTRALRFSQLKFKLIKRVKVGIVRPSMHAQLSPFDKTEETKQQNRRFSTATPRGSLGKRSSSPRMHPKGIIPYMQPMFHQKKIAAIVPLDLGLELCPQPWQKSKGATAYWGGQLSLATCQEVAKHA